MSIPSMTFQWKKKQLKFFFFWWLKREIIQGSITSHNIHIHVDIMYHNYEILMLKFQTNNTCRGRRRCVTCETGEFASSNIDFQCQNKDITSCSMDYFVVTRKNLI